MHHAQGILQITVPNDSILEDRVRRLSRDFERAGGSWIGNGVGAEDLPSRLVWVSSAAHVEAVFDRGVPFSLGDICEDLDIEGIVAKSMNGVFPPAS